MCCGDDGWADFSAAFLSAGSHSGYARRPYVVQFSDNDLKEEAWKMLRFCTKSKIKAFFAVGIEESGLKLVSRTYFRVAAINSSGQGPWSDVVSKYIV